MSSTINGTKADPKMLLRGALTTAGLSMYAAKLNPAACVSSASKSASHSLTVKRNSVAEVSVGTAINESSAGVECSAAAELALSTAVTARGRFLLGCHWAACRDATLA